MIKIVGDSNGDLFIESDGKIIAKILDEQECKYLFDESLFKDYNIKRVNLENKIDNLKPNASEYIQDNIEDYIDWRDIRQTICNAIYDCIDDFKNI